MSDDVDRTMARLEKENKEAGNPFSPDRMREVRQKLEGEAQQKAELAARKQEQLNAATQQSENQPVPRPDAPSPPSNEVHGLQPPAIGEKANADRAETGPEKKDKEIYLAEKRLSRL